MGRGHGGAARHDEELDSTRIVETASLSRAMSEDDTIGPAPGGNLIAAEYVLGVLAAQERREVVRRLEQEPALASEVAFWEERLGGLTDMGAPGAPPPTTSSRLEGAIGGGASPGAPPASVWPSL